MELITIIIIGVALLVMSIFDLKERKVISILPTVTILLALVMVIHTTPIKIVYGLLGLGFALVFWEMGFLKGVADLKAMVIVSLTITSLTYFFIFLISFTSIALIYQIAFFNPKKYLSGEEIPFLPVFFITYTFINFIQFINLI